jgi:hypothetical protein
VTFVKPCAGRIHPSKKNEAKESNKENINIIHIGVSSINSYDLSTINSYDLSTINSYDLSSDY